jgi:hypothetical protein
MGINSIAKTFAIVAWLTTATANATENVQQKCNELTYIKCDNETSECHYETVNIKNWKWKIWDFIVKIESWEVKVYIPESDFYTSVNHLINYWKWNCEIWKTKGIL